MTEPHDSFKIDMLNITAEICIYEFYLKIYFQQYYGSLGDYCLLSFNISQ